jgi:hypothetical protein
MYGNEAQEAKVGARERAMSVKARQMGLGFIRLFLTDNRVRSISGVECLHLQEFVNEEKGNSMDYHAEVRGGHLSFSWNPNFGATVGMVLDTEHNRCWLASHHGEDFWTIEDVDVEADIAKRADAIRDKSVKSPVSATVDKPKEKVAHEPKMEMQTEKKKPGRKATKTDGKKNLPSEDVKLNPLDAPAIDGGVKERRMVAS